MAEVFVRQFVIVGPDLLDYAIQEYQEVTEIRNLDGSCERIEGMKRYQLQYGGAVNKLSQREFKVVATGMVLTIQD
ncbi:hypothetical protein [Pseudomonas sp. BN515]|uniref:hypothetical protein n=1 Tax=Pseudomonas sp. BN515 TaxID=2567892 RepID=UPI002455B16A|nr:hypothetical protein [Pseudomonas sp. BN515]MDH4873003.1 hypothetical protein [Pseudomonas sp. BN515]